MNKLLQVVLYFALSLLVAAGVTAGAKETITSVSVTTKPMFVKFNPPPFPGNTPFVVNLTNLLLRGSNQTYTIFWNRRLEYSSLPLTLDTNRTYTFALELEKDFLIHRDTALLKIEEDGKTIYDQSICGVHKIKMERKEVPINHGDFRNPDRWRIEADRRLFPHRLEVAFGSDAISSDDPITEKVFVCSDCKQGYEKWKQANSNTK